MSEDARRYAPAAARNRDAILQVLSRHLPPQGRVLEVASGSGEHIVHFAAAHPGATFQPTDPVPANLASIDAWCQHHDLTNVAPAIALDATRPFALDGSFDTVICINMIHIAPWSATVGLMRGAASVLVTHGLLFLYGPFRRDGAHTAPSNEAFDAGLKAQNPDWGVRDLEAVAELAAEYGFQAPTVETMPANNLCLLFRRG